MTTRELRNQRREAERKAKKLEFQQSRQASALAPNPELLDEFTAEQQTEMMALRARVHSGATGPRTIHGKAASSGNSLKHGLASGRIMIPGEDPLAFESLLADLLTEHAPTTPTEQLLVQQMAQSWWLVQRAIRFQNEAFTETGVDASKLALFLRYQTTHEHAFYKALNTLVKSRAEFVSQNRRRPRPSPEFVSQNAATVVGEAPSAHVKFSDPPDFDHQAA